ncbi:hypothetical protein predicted by Glimmer/Critica [Sorangium cellulosum So ce56]|uniref:Uncharacterized protein n=1 Tax=Sorangium cellulosum (strain So ce56) TaxID=448385 RepID=A9F1Y0_SORC5|nr:hypothetical protein predicted by Glimmer/Critica [Sorangium cellulosum So ce56]
MALSLLVVSSSSCDRRSSPSAGGAASAAPAPSASEAVPAAAAASSAPTEPAVATAPAEPELPRGTGVQEFVPIGSLEGCKAKSGDIATYILREGMGIAGRADGSFGAVWLVDLKGGDAQIAFAGFDNEARQVARARAISSTRDAGLRIFSSGDEWAVTWFDAEGLAYARPRWETNPPVGIQRVGAIGREVSDHVALAPAPGGALVAAAPFGPDRQRLGVFQFAPVDPAQPQLKAVGVTRSAKKPRWPTVAADASGGYLVAWQDEEDGSIRASRFDAAGREGNAHVVAQRQGGDRPAGAAQETPDRDQRLGLVATGSAGALLVWSEGATLIARALDAEARPRGAPWVVGKGKWRALAPSGDGALVAWVGHDGKVEGQALLVKLAADGAPSARGIRVSDGVFPVKDSPSVALAGERVGVAWTEPMSTGVSTKRAVLRVLERTCIP